MSSTTIDQLLAGPGSRSTIGTTTTSHGNSTSGDQGHLCSVYFLKVDMEGAECRTIGPERPMHPWFQQGKVRHVVIEVFPVDTEVGYGGNAALLSYLYDMGFVCAHTTMGPSGALQPLVAWPSKVEAEGVFASTKHHGDTNWDVFCSIVRDLFVI